MRIERTRNAGRNIVFGLLLKVYEIIMPFLIRTVTIYYLGMQYLGLNSLFSSILQVLNLAELGIGNAMIYSMYKPIADDDTQSICALMKLYQIYYRIIGGVIAVLGIVIMPYLPYLIKDSVPSDMNIYVLYVLYLGSTVLSYWLFAYKNSIFLAHQRTDVSSKVTMAVRSVQYVLQFFVLIYLKNYYLFLILTLLSQAMTNVITAYLAQRTFPEYIPKGSLSRENVKKINQRIRDLFTAKLGGVIVNSADSVVISSFLGLTVLAVYQNYFFILTAIIGVLTIVFRACTAGIGNSVIVESKEKNLSDLHVFTLIVAWIAGFCSCSLLCLYQPFMRIWVGPQFLLEMPAVICFCGYFFVYEINQLLNTYKDASGIWHKDRFRPMITALSNLGMNLIMVRFWGIYGVLLSTVLSTVLIGMPWLINNLFETLFGKEYLWRYVKRLAMYLVVSFLSCVLTYVMCRLIPGNDWIQLILRGVICCIVPNITFWLSYRNLPEFAKMVQIVEKLTKGKIKFFKRVDT